jgi:hypothetical protein
MVLNTEYLQKIGRCWAARQQKDFVRASQQLFEEKGNKNLKIFFFSKIRYGNLTDLKN